MSKQNITITAIVVILLLGGIFLIAKKNRSVSPLPTPVDGMTQPGTSTNPIMSAQPSASTQLPTGTVKEFTVTGSNFKFDPAILTVNKGDTVKINFTSASGFHNWVVDAFNASSRTISSGSTDTVTFIADKSGSFEYYCSVGNHRAMGMKGTLVVK